MDPASIAFAALAEEYRRAGRYDESIATCTAGLQRHPAYLSAHVTLGRALLETGQYEEAREELEHVLKLAPENLAAIRGLAEIHHRRGELPESHDTYAAPEPTAAPDEAARADAPAQADAADARVEAPAAPPWEYGIVDPSPAPEPEIARAPERTPASGANLAGDMNLAADLSVAPALDPALEGLESFLAAITRARAAAVVTRD